VHRVGRTGAPPRHHPSIPQVLRLAAALDLLKPGLGDVAIVLASGASDVQVAHQMGHSKIETTKNIYAICSPRTAPSSWAHEPAVSRLYAYENQQPGEGEGENAVA
jgi:hypothetical protein